MAILVSDTSMLMDLERGGLLEAVFSLGLTFVVSEYLYESELADSNGPYLKHLGLGVLSLSSEENEVVQDFLVSNRGRLSPSDCSSLVCALRDNHSLLTGEELLIKVALSKNAEVCGIFWLLDQLEANGTANSILYEALDMISNNPKCRLPKDEVKKRLLRWE